MYGLGQEILPEEQPAVSGGGSFLLFLAGVAAVAYGAHLLGQSDAKKAVWPRRIPDVMKFVDSF